MTTETNTTRRRPGGWPLDTPYQPQAPERATITFLNRVFARYDVRLTATDRTTLVRLLRAGEREEAEDWLAMLAPRLPASAITLVCDWLTDGWCRDEVTCWWYRTYRNWKASYGMPKPLVFHWENV